MAGNLQKSLKKGFERTIKTKFLQISITGVLSILSFLIFGAKAFNLDLRQSALLGVAVFVGLVLLAYIVVTGRIIYFDWKDDIKESAYGRTFITLNSAFARIHWLKQLSLNWDTDGLKPLAKKISEKFSLEEAETLSVLDEWRKHHLESTEVQVLPALEQLCTQLKKTFDDKRQLNYSVSIKVVVATGVTADGNVNLNDPKAEVRNIARDINTALKRDTVAYNKISHFILDNSCYTAILEQHRQKEPNIYYVNNNINDGKQYYNTSKDAHPDKVLPYKSELVVPIIPQYHEGKEAPLIRGFVCVDCDTINAFDERYDPAIIQGVADCLYDLIDLRFQLPGAKKLSALTTLTKIRT